MSVTQERSEATEVIFLENPTLEEFEEKYYSLGQPIVITGAMDGLPSLDKWTPEYVAKQVGDRKLPIWKFDPATGPLSLKTEEMTLSEFLEKEKAGFSDNEHYYVGSLPIKQFLPELESEFSTPDFARREKMSASVLQFGARVFSQYHYHPYGSAVLLQMYGQKRIRLMPPSETKLLNKFEKESPFYNLSQYPLWEEVPGDDSPISKAKYYDVTLEAGQILFFPIYYWHGIKNDALNIAVTTFWYREYEDRFPPPEDFLEDYNYEPTRKELEKQAQDKK